METHNLLPAAIASCCVLLLMSRTAYGRLASFTYLGCFVDSPSARDLNELPNIGNLGGFSAGMTIEMCSRICSIGGWPYFGVQGSIGCYCGFTYGAYGRDGDSACSSNCGGNPAQKCGGSSRNSVFGQVYAYSDQFVPSPRVNITGASSTLNSYWNATAMYPAGCLIQCGATCQGVIFSQQLGACYLLRFAAVPADLVSVAGDFYVRR